MAKGSKRKSTAEVSAGEDQSNAGDGSRPAKSGERVKPNKDDNRKHRYRVLTDDAIFKGKKHGPNQSDEKLKYVELTAAEAERHMDKGICLEKEQSK